MDVYPSRRKIWTSIVGFAMFVLIALVAAIAVVSDGNRVRDWAFWLFAVVFIVWSLVASIRELRNPLPLARLDSDGFECALGRVPWANVSNVEIRWHWRARYPSRRVFFALRNPAEAPGPETREYLYRSVFGGPAEADGQIDLPLWDSQKRMLADVRRYYPAA